MHKKLKLVKESADVEEYWDATEIDGKGFVNLMKFNFGTDSKGNNYIVTNDANEVARFRADSDEEAKKKFREEFLKESTLNEDLEDEEDKEQEIEQTEEDLEDTLDSEENQEENPVEEESELDKQLDELRKVLVDLDLNLYQITSKEDPNNSIYIIGKVAEDTTDTLMLIDTKPEEHDEVEIEDEVIDVDNVDNSVDKVGDEETEEVEETPEERFDFVVLPKKFAEINELNPRYGADLTPDHEAIMDYLMNCLIEVNPDAVEDIVADDIEVDEELPLPTEDLEDKEDNE